jgi:hypothetical protein
MNRLYFYRSLITRIRQYLISKSGTNPVTLTNAVEDKLLQGFSITGNSQQYGAGGKNLFDISTATKYSGLATLEVKAEEQGINVTHSGSGAWVSANIIIAQSNYLIGKTITVSADVVPLSGQSCIRVMWLNGSTPVPGTMDIISNSVSYDDTNTICKATGTVTAPPTSDSKLCLMLFAIASVGYENNITTFMDIQIELGAVKTNYEQYYPLSTQHPSPIQTTELKKSSNLLDTADYFNEPKTINGVTIQYLADEDCFLLNGTATATVNYTYTGFLVSNAINQPFTISAFYVSGNITIPTGAYAVAYIGKQDDSSATQQINFMDAKLRQNNTNKTKICDKEYVKDFWFWINTGVVLENYKVKISVTKLENSFDISKVENHSSVTNTGDSLVITPTGTNFTSNSGQPLYTMCHGLNVGDKIIVNMTATTDGGVYNAFSSPKTRVYLSTYGTRVLESGTVYTLTADDLLGRPQWYSSSFYDKEYTENKSTITNISISKIPTNYEPYGKYGLEIKQEKNILDLYNAHNGQFMTVIEQSENKVVATANNATNNSPVLKLLNKSIPAGNYVLSYTVNIENIPQLQSGAGDRRNEMLIFVGGTFKTKTNSISQDGTYTNSITFTLQSASMVDIRWYRNVVNNVVTEDTTYKVTFTNVQLEQGTEASTYTPYQSPQYNRIWIYKPFLGETDILTYDGTNLKIVKKEFKINLKDDVVWSYIEPTESGSIGTIKGIVNGSADLYRTFLSNTSQTYLCTHYNSSFFDISREHTREGIITLTNTVLVFNGLQTDYDSFMEVINTGNVEMLIKYVNNRPVDQNQFTRTITSSSYIDLKPLSAGNNTLTVTNEISPTGCQYKYYSSKEN